MVRKRLIWQLFPAFLLIATTALIAATLFITQAVRSHLLAQFEADLSTRALLIAPQFNDRLAQADYAQVDKLCSLLDAGTDAHIMVYLSDGRVVGDSRSESVPTETTATPREVVAALAGEQQFSKIERHGGTKQLMYTAHRIAGPGGTLGVVRVGQSLTPISSIIQAMYFWLLIGATLVATGVALASWRVSHRIIDPIEQMKKGAIRFANGHLDEPVALPESLEMAELAEAMNAMARELDERIRSAFEQRGEQEAILSSMVEGVVAVDTEQVIFSINRAAARLFGATAEEVQGKNIQHAIRNSRLIELINDTLREGQPQSAEITLLSDRDKTLQAQCSTLKNAAGQAIGVVVVLNDVTDLRRLERIRSDFVANVSHELKTPITSIKGFVETMIDTDEVDAEDTKRFLGIVAKQADRLHTIIEDLLTLSRIEQEEEVSESYLTSAPLKPVMESAAQLCTDAADAKEIRVDVRCDESLRARINAPLLEQSLINLIDNAIKYSDAGSKIELTAVQSGSATDISVRDFGCGIPSEHLPRLFERFYRVDKARSRAIGGTGLGLAIVKHIAKAHGGSISVTSRPGEGTTFILRLQSASTVHAALRVSNA